MAKVKGIVSAAAVTPGEVSAAEQWLDEASSRIDKHRTVLANYRSDVEKERNEAIEALQDSVAAHEKEVASMRATHDKEITALTERVRVAESKVARSFAELSR